jgi:hypothetical protein
LGVTRLGRAPAARRRIRELVKGLEKMCGGGSATPATSIELERARGQSGRRPAPFRRGPRAAIPGRAFLGIAAVAVAVAVIVTLTTSGRSRSKPEPVRPPGIPLRVDVTDPDIPRWPSTDSASVAISPDGKTIAYLAKERSGVDARICLRPADEIHAIRQVPSPELSYALSCPFFSPDGKWLGFAATGLYKMALSGGQPILLTESRSIGGMKGAV